MNHAGALRDSRDRHLFSIQFDFPRYRLGLDVRGHDRLGRFEPAIPLQIGQALRQPGSNPVDRQRLEDHARREGQYLIFFASQKIGERPTGLGRTHEPILPCACIGAARIDDKRTDAGSSPKVLLAQQDGSRAKAVFREHACHSRPRFEFDDEQIAPVRLADIGSRRTQPHPAN